MFGWLMQFETPSPGDSESGSPSSSESPVDPSQAVEETVSNVAEDVLSTDWWLSEFMPTAIRIVVILVIGILVRQLLMKFVNRTVRQMTKARRNKIERLDHDQKEAAIAHQRDIMRAETIGKLFKNITTIIVFTFVVLLILAELGFDIGPLIAGAGFIGVALGFGAQSLVADFMNGIFMMMEDQFGVGDVVHVTGASNTDVTGTVETVNLRTTEIRGIDGTLFFVRNGEIFTTGNMSQDWSRGVLDVGVAYETDVRSAKEILARVGRDFAADNNYGDLVLQTPEVWGVQELGADSVVLRMVIKTRPGDQWAVSRELLERIKYALDEAGIEIPFPQRTVWLREPGAEDADPRDPTTSSGNGKPESSDPATPRMERIGAPNPEIGAQETGTADADPPEHGGDSGRSS